MNRYVLCLVGGLSILWFFLGLTSCQSTTPKPAVYHPDQVFGSFFETVQEQKVLGDYKTFVDAIPKRAPDSILADYALQKQGEHFDLKAFVLVNFELPSPLPEIQIDPALDMRSHLKQHWKNLVRQPVKTSEWSTQIELPYPYVVPGGRFRELFYWDSYFSLLGLLSADEDSLALGMIRNFGFLIDEYGYIPNGNRSYFLSRSQPPFFAATLRAWGNKHGFESLLEFLPQLEKEYAFWMDQSLEQTGLSDSMAHVIDLFDDHQTNRYYGAKDYARAEGFGKEMRWAQAIPEAERPAFFRNLRTVCESGWDFSTRWYADGKNKSSIHAMDLIPVDLNSLIFMIEDLLYELYEHKGDSEKMNHYQALSQTRKEWINIYLTDISEFIYLDYDFVGDSLTNRPSLAMLYPLFAGCSTSDMAQGVARYVEKHFLQPGGLVTTLVDSGEQWDYPNGWAPHQWIGAIGLINYGYEELGEQIIRNWLALNEKVYRETGKMMEKYNVVDTSLIAGGGEYPNQDGFGWTNGVNLAFYDLLDDFPQ
ncbi:MAG: trehalase family glycosidase [Bacteroidota bacterium]